MNVQTGAVADVAARGVAAIAGGYGLAALVAAACAVSLPASRADAVLSGMLLSTPVHAAAFLWVFAARTAWRGWAGLLLAACLPGAALLFANW